MGHPRYKGATLREVQITNTGHRPVTIVSFGAIGLYPHKSLAGVESVPQLPYELREGQFISSFWEQTGLDFSKIDYWVVRDSYDHTYKLCEASILKHWKSVLQQRKALRKDVPSSVLAAIFEEFRRGLWLTTAQKYVDVAIFVAPFLALIFQKPKSTWEFIAPAVWAVIFIVFVHWAKATYAVWKRVSSRPVTKEIDGPASWSRLKLVAASIIGVLVLMSLSYWVRVQQSNSLLTYVYLVPTSELVECKQRAFFIKAHGPLHVSGLLVTLTDDKSGQTSTQKYPDFDADTVSEFLWVTPSHPWDEKYIATFDAHELHSTQKLTIQSHNKTLQLLTTVMVPERQAPVLKCDDMKTDDPNSCFNVLKLEPDSLKRLDVSSYEKADGNVQILRIKQFPSPSELDEQSDDRHLTEFQQRALEPFLSKYPGTRITIFYAGGDRSKAYAEEWYRFLKSKWLPSNPELVPLGNEGILDVQITVGGKLSKVKGESNLPQLLDALDKSGVKHAHHFTIDPNIEDGDLMLWVGPKSPKDINPDQCAGAQMKQKTGEPHTCDLIRQTTGTCPFVPR